GCRPCTRTWTVGRTVALWLSTEAEVVFRRESQGNEASRGPVAGGRTDRTGFGLSRAEAHPYPLRAADSRGALERTIPCRAPAEAAKPRRQPPCASPLSAETRSFISQEARCREPRNPNGCPSPSPGSKGRRRCCSPSTAALQCPTAP